MTNAGSPGMSNWKTDCQFIQYILNNYMWEHI